MINYFDNSRRQVGFIPDIHRILDKYSFSYVMQEFIENGIFMSKYPWKRILKVKISSISRAELLLKANDSVSLSRFLDIHNSSEPYLLYKIIKETPTIYKYGKLAVRLLSFMFSGSYIMVCRSCGDVTNKLSMRYYSAKKMTIFALNYGRV